MFSDFGIPNPFRPNPAGDNKDTERQKLSSKLSKINAAIEKIEKSILKSTSDSSKKFSLREFSSNLPGIKQFLEKRLVTLKGQRQELESKLKDVQERFLPVESSQNTFENKVQRAVAAKNISTLTSLAENATLSDLRSLPLTLVETVLQYVPEDKVIKLAASQELMAKDVETIKERSIEIENKVVDEQPQNADDQTIQAKIDDAKNSDQLLKNYRSQLAIRALATVNKLTKEANNNPSLPERIGIRNQLEALESILKNNPELKKKVTDLRKQESDIISTSILEKFEAIKTSPDPKKSILELSAPERQEMLKNPGCKDEEVKRIIENTQKEVAAKNIVNEVKNGFSIVSNGENSKIALSEVLIVRSKSVIAADYLFHAAFRELQNNPTEKQQERIINFCISWAAANRGTTEFTKAQNSLEDIAKLAHISQDKRDVLMKIIQRRPIPTPTPVFESATPVSLKSILMNIGTQDLSTAQSQKAIAQMANDLLTINNRLYQGLDRTDLAVSKWQNGYSPSAKNITNFFNQLTSYITYTIVGEQNVEKQKQGIKFFIAVAEACKQRNDIASLKSILGALNSALIMNLKTSKGTSVLEEVVGTENKPTQYGLLLKEANTLTSEASNSKELRKFYEDSQKKDILVTPYIGTFLQESTFLEDQPQLATTGLEETANFAKLSKLIETENKFLNFKHVAGPDTDLIVTDIYSQVTDLKVPQEFLDLRKYDLDARRLKENLSRLEMRQLEKALTGNNAGKPPSEKVAAALKAALTLQKHIALMNASAEFPALQDQVRRFAENDQYPTLQKALNDLANSKNPLGAIPYFKKVLEELDNFSNVPELKNLTTALQQSAFAKYVKL